MTNSFSLAEKSLQEHNIVFPELIAHYETQKDPYSCSLASLTMVLNAIQKDKKFTQKEIISMFPDWEDALESGIGVNLDQLLDISLELGFKVKCSRNPQEMIDDLTSQRIVLANYLKNWVGHFSPIGAYDPLNQKILILDVDPEQIPYWVPLDALVANMQTLDPQTKKFRGFLTFY